MDILSVPSGLFDNFPWFLAALLLFGSASGFGYAIFNIVKGIATEEASQVVFGLIIGVFMGIFTYNGFIPGAFHRVFPSDDEPKPGIEILRCAWTNPFYGTEVTSFWEVDLENGTITNLDLDNRYTVTSVDDRLIKGGAFFLTTVGPQMTVELDRRTLVLKTRSQGVSGDNARALNRKEYCVAQSAARQV